MDTLGITVVSAVVFFPLLLILYVVVRVLTTAFFRSKLDYERKSK